MSDVYTSDYEEESKTLTFYVNLKEIITWIAEPDDVETLISDFELIFKNGMEYGQSLGKLKVVE